MDTKHDLVINVGNKQDLNGIINLLTDYIQWVTKYFICSRKHLKAIYLFIICRPYSNKFYKHWDRGVYSCVVCGEELFLSHAKYDSGSGWPAFYDIISWNRVSLKQDLSHGEESQFPYSVSPFLFYLSYHNIFF